MNQFQSTGFQGSTGVGKAGKKPFEPTGFVQSFYRQNQPQQTPWFGTNPQQLSYGVQSGYQAQPQSFHTAAYKGDQPNHDQSWRADSVNPNSTKPMGANYQWQYRNQ